MRRLPASLTVALVVLGALGLGGVATAGAAPTERADIQMPFAGQWANEFGTAPWEHGRHQDQDWAMDLFAVDAPVRLNIGDATGVVGLEVTDVVLDTTCGGAAGSYVTVVVSVDGTAVGTVLYHHLIDVRVVEGQRIAPGKVLGRTVASPGALGGNCWSVSTPMGIHTHMAVANARGFSCYVRHQVGQALTQPSVIGSLGHRGDGQSVGAGPRADCAEGTTTVQCQGQVATIVGTTGADELVGTKGPDVIVALGGRDHIKALGGDDVICGGPGADRIEAGGGADNVHAGGGDDLVFGGAGDDRVLGWAGADDLRGGAGNDRILGGRGVDLVRGQAGRDKLLGGDDDDVLRGGSDSDVLAGKRGHDRCMGGADVDRVHLSCEIVARTP